MQYLFMSFVVFMAYKIGYEMGLDQYYREIRNKAREEEAKQPRVK